MVLSWAPAATAQSTRPDAVLVLEAQREGAWKEGVQALVAELLTTGRELSVRAARSGSLDELERELQQAVDESAATAAVSLAREGRSATALLCRRGVSACERLRMEVADAELSRSRLAVAVVERLRPLDLPAPAEPLAVAEAPAQPAVTPPVTERPRVGEPATARAAVARAWLGGGVVASSGMSAPMPWLSASLRVMVVDPWGVELLLGGSPLPGSAESSAGSLSLSVVQAMAFATFEPFARRSWGLTLGLGGGALRLQETASPAAGFEGASHATTVGVVSTRARLHHRVGPVYASLSLEPGVMVPAVKVQAGSETVLRIGRPWLGAQMGLGIDL